MADFAVKSIAVLLFLACSAMASAQDVRYSWFDIAFVQQDVDRDGRSVDNALSQVVDIAASDGSGTKFRGSVGTWHNIFAFVDFSSSDIDVGALIENTQGQFTAEDEFDFTSARAGIGVKWSLTESTDIYGAVSYDSMDFDFGSFAGENFDVSEKDVGAEIGVRSMVTDKTELRGSVRYSGVGDVNLNGLYTDPDTLYSVGFGYALIRGFSIIGDYESGEFSSWHIGFRLDLDEDWE